MRGGNRNVDEVGVMGEEKLAVVVLVQIVITIAKHSGELWIEQCGMLGE